MPAHGVGVTCVHYGNPGGRDKVANQTLKRRADKAEDLQQRMALLAEAGQDNAAVWAALAAKAATAGTPVAEWFELHGLDKRAVPSHERLAELQVQT